MIMLTVLMGLELTQMPYSCASLSISIQQHLPLLELRFGTRHAYSWRYPQSAPMRWRYGYGASQML